MQVDSRLVGPGDLFVALPGERVDGHDHVQAAFEAGAVAALVTRRVDSACPQLVVPDALRAGPHVKDARRRLAELPGEPA